MLPLGWRPSPPLASSLLGMRGVKPPGVGVWGAHHQLPALPCALLEDAGVDPLWNNPALLPLSLEGPCPAPTVAQLGPLRTPQCNGGPHPSAPQVSAEPCNSGGSSSECWARRKCPSEGERSSSTMFTHLSVPGSPLLSWTPIFIGTGGASRFSERPCKVKNKTAETPTCLDTVPGRCTNTAPCPTIVPML